MPDAAGRPSPPQAKRFHELKCIPAQNAIFVLHEVIRDTTITDENTEVITKDFLEKLSKAVAGNLVLLEFMTSLHRGFSDSHPGTATSIFVFVFWTICRPSWRALCRQQSRGQSGS